MPSVQTLAGKRIADIRRRFGRRGAIELMMVLAIGLASTACTVSGDGGSGNPSSFKYKLWSDGVNLRGANMYQRRVYPTLDGDDFLGPGPIGPPLTQGDFDALAALGANYVNLSHPGLFNEQPPYQLDPSVRDNLDSLIAMAAQADLFCVVSFRTGPGRSEFAIFEGQDWFPQSLVINTVWTEQTAQDAWSEMWQYTADRYRDRQNVVGYDLMVEPNGSSTALGIFDPDGFYPEHAGSLVDWNQMYPDLLEAIRQVDEETPVLVSAMNYGSRLWLPYFAISDDPRVVYTVHQYEPFAFSHQGPNDNVTYPGPADTDGQTEQVDRDWLDQLMSPIDEFRNAYGATVAINEFGAVRWANGMGAYLRDEVDLFEARGINHAIWLWEADWPPLSQADDFNLRHGDDPQNHEAVVAGDGLNAIREIWSANKARPSNPLAR